MFSAGRFLSKGGAMVHRNLVICEYETMQFLLGKKHVQTRKDIHSSSKTLIIGLLMDLRKGGLNIGVVSLQSWIKLEKQSANMYS